MAEFAANIKADAKDKGVDHKMAIIGFAASSAGSGSSVTGSHDSPGSSTGAWRNTGLFVNGTLKNYQTYSDVYTAVYNVNNYGTYYILNGTEYQQVYYCGAITTDEHDAGWFTQSHGIGSHGGQAVSPKTAANDTNTSHVQFYTQSEVAVDLTAQDYRNGFVSVYDSSTDAVTASITTAIGKIAANGGTYTHYGLEMAKQVFANNPQRDYTKADGTTGKSPRIVVLFTDGDTDSDKSTLATDSNTLKATYGATVYSVAFGTSLGSDDIAMLQHVSSNYGSNVTYNNQNWGGTSQDTKYYMTATNKTELDNIFSTITKNELTPSTSVTLGSSAVMKDILSDEFKLPAGYNANSSISVKTQAGTANSAGEITWGAITENPEGITATANVETGTIDITGFDYSSNYITYGHDGAKLIVTISGIAPTSDAFTGTPIYTNDPKSGVYEDGDQDTPFQSFDSPTATLHSKSYVLDYAKPVTVNASDWDQAKIYALMASAGAVTGESNAAAGTYGDATSTATTITYSPKTMEWKGYDSFYSFDNTEGAFSWAKINFIPANNVYFEDDFITTSTDGTTATGTVGFVYGSGWTVETTGETGNGESADTSVHGGWQNADLADDTGFSDGSAHMVTSKAKASFTFTGTGVDVYTRTNASSGGIRATLYKWNEETSSWDTLMIQYMNNLAESGDYYQIPTLSLHSVTGTDLAGNSVDEPLTYGKYKVDLIAYVIDGNATYYLDGIRIYNPAQEAENDTEDTTVGDAYEEDNALQAVFTEVRDILIDNGNFNAGDETVKGAVFIDSIDVTDEETQTSVTTQEIGTYVDYGPKNEVYLAKDQMIAIAVNETEGAHYFVGLKAPAGATTAKITNGSDTSELSIGHSTDLYYEVVPNADGLIIIENTTDNLLSVTKLQTTGTGSSDVVSVNTVMLMSYANEFDSLPVVAYSLRAPKPEVEEPEVTEPEATEPEATEPEATEPEATEPEATEPETPDVEIEIENPEPAPEQKPEQKPNTGIRDLVKKIFGFLSKWF